MAKQEKENLFAFSMECADVFSKNRVPMAYAARDFPKRQLVYYCYRKWIDAEVFDLILDKLRSKVRISNGLQTRATLGIVDSQSVRWGSNRSFKSYDGNKKVKGIKRHMVVDKNGFLLSVMVTVAHVHDSKAVMLLLMRVLRKVSTALRLL